MSTMAKVAAGILACGLAVALGVVRFGDRHSSGPSARGTWCRATWALPLTGEIARVERDPGYAEVLQGIASLAVVGGQRRTLAPGAVHDDDLAVQEAFASGRAATITAPAVRSAADRVDTWVRRNCAAHAAGVHRVTTG